MNFIYNSDLNQGPVEILKKIAVEVGFDRAAKLSITSKKMNEIIDEGVWIEIARRRGINIANIKGSAKFEMKKIDEEAQKRHEEYMKSIMEQSLRELFHM